MSILLFTVLTLCVLGVLSAVVLYFVAQKFKVEEDPRIDEVEKMLPGANCGGCGFAGCRAMAEALVKRDDISELFCPVGGGDTMKAIATYLGKAAPEKEPRVATVRCGGTCEKRPRTNTFDGARSWCRRFVALCRRNGLRLRLSGLWRLCDGMCFRRHSHQPRNRPGRGRHREVYGLRRLREGLPQGLDRTAQEVAQRPCNLRVVHVQGQGCRGDEGLQGRLYRVAASARRCASSAAIKVENNLAFIDSDKCRLCRKCVNECPTGAIKIIGLAPLPKAPKAAPVAAAAPAAKTETVAPKAGPAAVKAAAETAPKVEPVENKKEK